MKIAYVVPYVPNLIRTRPYNLINQLTSLGHEVVVFTVGSNKQDYADAQALKANCKDVHYHLQPIWRSLVNSALAVPTIRPLQSVYSWQRGMAKNLVKRIRKEEFDIVHVEHLRGSRYGVYIKSKFPTIPVVWDSVDCISHLFQQAAVQSSSFFGKFITRFELSRTQKTEGDLVCCFDHILVTSPDDKEALIKLSPNGRKPSPISVLSNGVDLNYFYPNPNTQRDSATIVFSGKMSYHANISMVKYLVSEIMPRIWNSRPETKLFIVGKDPNSDIKKLGNNHLIKVTGTVKDIRPYLWRATVSIVPLLYGAGIQNKILEAMATGTPVITTPRTLSALQAKPGKDLLIATDAEEFARKTLMLMNDPDLMRSVGDSGLAYVRGNHDWNSLTVEMIKIYQQTLDRHHYI